MTTYTLRYELDDATLEKDFLGFSNKAKAISAARRLAKQGSWGTVKLVVWNAEEGSTVAEFDVVRG